MGPRAQSPPPPPLRDGVQVRLRSAAAAPGPGQGPETSERPRLCLPAAEFPLLLGGYFASPPTSRDRRRSQTHGFKSPTCPRGRGPPCPLLSAPVPACRCFVGPTELCSPPRPPRRRILPPLLLSRLTSGTERTQAAASQSPGRALSPAVSAGLRLSPTSRTAPRRQRGPVAADPERLRALRAGGGPVRR